MRGERGKGTGRVRAERGKRRDRDFTLCVEEASALSLARLASMPC